MTIPNKVRIYLDQLAQELADPQHHAPGNYASCKQAVAYLESLCQEAAGAINEILYPKTDKTDGVLRNGWVGGE
jgi:hypothetical protein